MGFFDFILIIILLILNIFKYLFERLSVSSKKEHRYCLCVMEKKNLYRTESLEKKSPK